MVNGPPGIGKSTIARRYCEFHPFTLRIDVDDIRDLISDWQRDPTAAGTLARRMTVEMARAFLGAGHDVIISQLFGKAADLETLQTMANDVGSEMHEFIVMADRVTARQRFLGRGGEKFEQLRDNEHWIEQFDELYDRVQDMVQVRTQAVVIEALEGQASETLQALIGHLDET